jgi:hypothetical protein
MPGNVQGEVVVDGSVDFSGGVDSIKVTTVASRHNPDGLQPSELAWLDNATVRDGGITTRYGWQFTQHINNGNVLFQGGFMYQPVVGFPYLILCFSGHVYKVTPENPTALVDLSTAQGGTPLVHPATAPHFYFCQAEEFLIIQAGDGVTLPLFWNGATLRRSRGLIPGGQVTGPAPTAYQVTLTNNDSATNAVFPATPTSDNPLGAPYNTWQAPTIGSNVTVNCNAPIPASVTVGQVLDFVQNKTGKMTLTNVTYSAPNWVYTYNNVDILSGANVPAQYAPAVTPPYGASFPAFVAWAPTVNGTFNFPSQLVNPGTQNTWTYPVHNHFTVQSIAQGEAQIQSTVSELPAAGPMTYYMGRVWYAQGRQYAAGDIVYGVYGTTQYNFRDSVLKITENPLALGGDGFTLPANAGVITALFYNANLNATLGQGQLFVSTRKMIFALQVPVSRNDWITSDAKNQPMQTVIQIANGVVGDRSVVLVNGDVFYQSLEPGIRSLFASLRYFDQWGNIEISNNEQRILNFVDRSLLSLSWGIMYDNRLLMSSLPAQKPQGVVHQAIIPMDFLPMSQFAANINPIWEGMYEGLDFFQAWVGDYGGLERAWALVLSRVDGSIDLYEITNYQRTDINPTNEDRVTWIVEFPSFSFQQESMFRRLIPGEWQMKKLTSAELWVDRVYGKVDFKMEYRPDGENCWRPWHQWQICSARTSAEDVINPISYPLAQYGETYKETMTLPSPPDACGAVSMRPRPEAYQFQCRLTVQGFCRLRGLLLKALPLERKLFQDQVC